MSQNKGCRNKCCKKGNKAFKPDAAPKQEQTANMMSKTLRRCSNYTLEQGQIIKSAVLHGRTGGSFDRQLVVPNVAF